MSGHSKWSTIKRQKGVTDIKRGQTFTKLANAITIAARLGSSGDPSVNPRLRAALESARQVNMPKENVQRAVDRGLGKLPGQMLEEVTYEGFGPPVGGGKVAFYIEVVTDNRSRANQEVKNIFERSGGNLGGPGSTAYMFDRKGEIRVNSKGGEKEKEMLELIDLGAEDVEDYFDNQQKYLVYVESPELNTMSNKVTQAGYGVEEAEIIYKPNMVVDIKDGETAKKVMDFTERLEDLGDVQKVYANFEIDEGLI